MRGLGSCAATVVGLVLLSCTPAWAETVTETVCSDPDCSENCVPTDLKTNHCYQTSVAGTSIKLRCRAGGTVIEQVIYQDSSICDSFSHTSTAGAGECGQVVGGSEYIMFTCGGFDKRSVKITPATGKEKFQEAVLVRNYTVDLLLDLPKTLDPSVKQQLGQLSSSLHRDLSKRTVFLPNELLALLASSNANSAKALNIPTASASITSVYVVRLDDKGAPSGEFFPLKPENEDLVLKKDGILLKEDALRRVVGAEKKGHPVKVALFFAGKPVVTFVLRR